MALIEIMEGEKVLFKGKYEYVEGGVNKSGNPSFHIEVSNRDAGYQNREIHVSFESIDEFDKFVDSLTKQVKERDYS